MNYFKDIYTFLTKKYPNSKVYVISDHHFFHDNIIKYGRLEFSNIQEMNDFIINIHNETVANDDIVIFLGDFSFKKNEIQNMLSIMNGHKFLLMGNHDKESIINCYKNLGFEGLFDLPVKFKNSYLSHYPLGDKSDNSFHKNLLLKEFNHDKDSINYHGHIHTKNKVDSKSINVTCESIDYKPILIGHTVESQIESLPTFLSSKELDRILNQIGEEKNFSRSLLINDYIYSIILESIENFNSSCCIYGSYPQYKKYGYISNFSDIDIGIIYNKNISKNENSQVLKDVINASYAKLNQIDNISLYFIKKYSNMSAFNYSYMNGKDKYIKGAVDANLVPYNFYKDSDFITFNDSSAIEKFIQKEEPNILEQYSFPKFSAFFLTNEADISNLVLQILFQKGNEQKKEMAIKKLKYIYNYFGTNILEKEIENILIRYYLRNIAFLYTLRRLDEIDYIRQKEIISSLTDLPNSLLNKLDNILLNSNSKFNCMLKEIKNIDKDNILEVGISLTKKLD